VHGHCLIYTSLIETACSRSKRSCHPGLRIVKFVAGAMRIIVGGPEIQGQAATSGRFARDSLSEPGVVPGVKRAAAGLGAIRREHIDRMVD